jgi:hypothetical protein
MDTDRFLTWQNIERYKNVSDNETQRRLILGLLFEELKTSKRSALPDSTLEASSSRPKSIDPERSPQTLRSRAPTEASHIGDSDVLQGLPRVSGPRRSSHRRPKAPFYLPTSQLRP